MQLLHDVLFHSAAAPCGGRFISNQGEVTSPNWPSDYNAQSVCTWLINVPSAESIRVAFTDFELQAVNLFGNCVDYVEIFNGETMASLGLLPSHRLNLCSVNSLVTLFSFSVIQVGSAASPHLPPSPSPATRRSSAF